MIRKIVCIAEFFDMGKLQDSSTTYMSVFCCCSCQALKDVTECWPYLALLDRTMEQTVRWVHTVNVASNF